MRPKAMEVAIGIKNWACKEVSNSSGVNPAMVVKEVSKTALSLFTEASTSASSELSPFSNRCL